MSQIKIKQIDQLEQSLNAITGVTTVVESYATNQATGNTGIQNTFEAKEVSGVKVHVNGLQIEDFSWLNVTTDYVPAGSNLVFDSVAAGFELQSTDVIKLTYEYLANGSSTYTGSGSGSTGAQGAVGPQGVDGATGPQGTDGAQGATGAAGSGGSGNISGTVDGSLIPDSNDSYDLGSAEYKFRDLYLGDNTLHMGDKSLSRTNIDDSMEIKNISIPSSQTSEGNRGDVVFDDAYMYICISTNSWKRINLDTSW